MRYKLFFDDIATTNSTDGYKTVAGILVANTTGHRIRVRSVQIGPADDSPDDVTLGVKLARIASISGGGAGTYTSVSAANLAKVDPGQRDAIVTGGRNWSAEPTSYETEALWGMGFNQRGGVIKEWDEADAPVATADMFIGLLVCQRASAVEQVSGCIEFEEY